MTNRKIIKNTIIFVLTTVLISCSTIKNHEKDELKYGILFFEGIYQSEKKGDYWSYLRFYPDQTVISVSSSGIPSDLKIWFDKDNENISIGRIVVKGNTISFSTTSREGKVDYTGAIINEKLHLEFFSQINSNKGKEVYKFIKW